MTVRTSSWPGPMAGTGTSPSSRRPIPEAIKARIAPSCAIGRPPGYPRSMPPPLAAAVVFGTSAAVLVLEIIAGRLLAPHVGVTLETYTGIIGTVLAGIALGAWLGGRAADRTDPRRLPGPLLMAGGALALATIPLIELLADLRLRPDPAGIVTYVALAILPPAAVLSAVSPAVVKLRLHDLRETGAVVGRLSA